jgi:hypothetical protein
MDLRVSYGLNDTLIAQRSARAVPIPNQTQTSPSQASSTQLVNIPTVVKTGTKLIKESQEPLENGLRRTQTFERTDGRSFTRIEELTLTERGARRTVIQQNPSGSLTRYEEILDRQDSGTFRRTQLFQEASGEIATQITSDYKVTDPFVLSGGSGPIFSSPSPFHTSRGTQLDLQV